MLKKMKLPTSIRAEENEREYESMTESEIRLFIFTHKIKRDSYSPFQYLMKEAES